MTLLPFELATLVGLAILVAIPIRIREYFDRSRSDRRPVAVWLVRAACLLAIWWLISMYVFSWGSFRSVGRFLDVGGVAFWMTNPVQNLQHVAHMEPYSLVVLPLATLAAASALLLAVPFATSRLAPRSSRFVLGGFVGIFVAMLLMNFLASQRVPTMRRAVVDPDVGVVYTEGDLFATLRDERSGPMTHFFADLRHELWDTSEPVLASDEIEQVRRPLVETEDFLADVADVNRLSVIIVIVESLRNDQLVLYGGEREVMPNVEALGREGRAFTNHYTQSSHSNYSDLAPLSSHYPLRSRRTHVYPADPTYPRVLIYDVLKFLGYSVGVFSSQNENWGGMINYLRTGNIDRFLHAENFEGPTYVPRTDAGFTRFVRGTKRSGKIDDRFTVEEAMEWIDGVDGPFFVYMNLQNSHVPYERPADFPPRFGPGEVSFVLRFGVFPPDSADAVKDLYANSLAYVDFQIGRLIEHLKATGRWDSTIIVVTGDTGQAFFEHGFAAHANQLYNEVMQVPLIIRSPGLGAGTDDRLAQHIDVPPTIFHLLGLPPHPGFQGVDLLDPAPNPDRSVFLVAQSPLAHQYAIVRRNLKLIFDARRRRYMLYDLASDPGETMDVSNVRIQEGIELAMRLDTWRRAQIEYYERTHIHSRWYPPVLADN